MTCSPPNAEAVAAHEWRVPERYNVAADVCDRHAPAKLAMIHEDPQGRVHEVRWGELQSLSNQVANVLRQRGVEKGERVAMLAPPTATSLPMRSSTTAASSRASARWRSRRPGRVSGFTLRASWPG